MVPFREGWTFGDIDAAIEQDDPAVLLHVPIVVSLNPPDCGWAQEICLRLATHAHSQVRANAILGFGHLARLCGALDEARVRPILEAAIGDPDPIVRGQAEAACDDVEFFLGWTLPPRAT